MERKITRALLLSLMVLSVIQPGCSRDDDDDNNVPAPKDESFNVRLHFEVDGQPLVFNQEIYTTDAGYTYAVDRMQFYVSAFEFEKSDGSKVESDEVVYVDIKENKGVTFKLSKIPQGNYTRVSFLVGLDSAHNITDALPNTIDNVNMAWPEMMGGGYHHMKFEGNYTDNGTLYGFAMHIGRNEYVVPVGVEKTMNITNATDTLRLTMNLNEWFRNPHIYDFNTDGNYSMGNAAAMLKLSENGRDVFDE